MMQKSYQLDKEQEFKDLDNMVNELKYFQSTKDKDLNKTLIFPEIKDNIIKTKQKDNAKNIFIRTFHKIKNKFTKRSDE